LRNKNTEKCSSVTWTGIQKSLEQAESDVLILLDCCSAGVANAGEGNGVRELMSACAYDVEANGVGHYSFTKALTIELGLLSRRLPFLSVSSIRTHTAEPNTICHEALKMSAILPRFICT
jgi:hypothetical protein